MDRRRLLAGAAAVATAAAAGPVLVVPRAWAPAPAAAGTALREVFGGKTVQSGKVKLAVPVLAENGNSVQVTLGVEGGEVPKRLVMVAPGNPHPLVTEIRFGPRAAKGEATMRVRLARSQTVVAGAELADGSCWATTADITVTAGACAEGAFE